MTPIQQQVNEWRTRTGLEATVTVRWADGTAYRDRPEWFGETERHRVGPCAHVDEVLRRLEELEARP